MSGKFPYKVNRLIARGFYQHPVGDFFIKESRQGSLFLWKDQQEEREVSKWEKQ